MRILAHTPGVLFHILILMAAAWPIWEARLPGAWFLDVFLILLFLPFIIFHFIRLALFCSAIGKQIPPSQRFARWPLWLTPPLLLIACFILQANAETIAIGLSRSRLEAYAAQIMANPSQPRFRNWVGLYPVSTDAIFQEGVLLYTGRGYDGARTGFAYFPNTPPPENTEIHYYPVASHLYTYWQHGSPGAPPVLPTTLPSARGL
jgi:hypothetical protein